MDLRRDRILTTHTGSLPRPDDLVELLWQRQAGESVDNGALQERVRQAVAEVVARQVATGLDIVNDGEAGKLSYAAYITTRLTGFTGDNDAPGTVPADLAEFPSFTNQLARDRRYRTPKPAACVSPIRYRGTDDLQRDLTNLRQTVAGREPVARFVSAASPGVTAFFHPNRFYADYEAYVWALAEAMREEYEAIHRAGFVLQLDCPDLGAGFHAGPARTIAAFRAHAATNIAALNHATASIPPARMRLHLCWGNYEGPHNHDIPLREIVDVALDARPAGLSIEGANPRHAHEWRVWEEIPLPDGKTLIPGVIDTTTNFIEHPALIAERIIRYAGVVGRDRIIAGTDCGFATVAGSCRVEPTIAWAKLGALVEGAQLASAELWP